MQTRGPIKRDFNLIRKIMLHIAKGFQAGQHFQLPPYQALDATVDFHVYLLKVEGMIEAHAEEDKNTGSFSPTWIVSILPAGYDFIGLIQDDNNWNAVMESFAAVHREPNFKDLIYRLEHIDEALLLKEQRTMVKKQSWYAKVTMIATCVMTAAIVVQAVFMYLTFSHSTAQTQSQQAQQQTVQQASQVVQEPHKSQLPDTSKQK